MALLFLIRHGQASAHEADYDQLSSLGYQQCEILKQFLHEEQIHPTKVFFGPRKRHRQTCESIRQDHWPDGVLLPALDEYPAHELLEFGMEQLVALEPHLREQVELIQSSTHSAGPDYVTLLQYSAQHWMNAKINHDDIETYKQYQIRLQTIQTLIQEAAPEDCIILVSSAGFISTLLTHLVGGKPEYSLNTAWSLYNASISTIYVKDFPSIASINQIYFLPKEYRTFI